jgi:hypothetical protein
MLLHVSLVLALSGCSDSSGSEASSARHVVSMQLTGDLTEQFTVSASPADSNADAAIAAGTPHVTYTFNADSAPTISIVARRRNASGKWEQLLIVTDVGAGTSPIGSVAGVYLQVGMSALDPSTGYTFGPAEASFQLISGSVTVQEVSTSRFRGTFSGSGYHNEVGTPATMTNGSFEIGSAAAGQIHAFACRVSNC